MPAAMSSAASRAFPGAGAERCARLGLAFHAADVHQRLQVPQDIFPVFRHKSIDLFQKKFFVHKQSPCIVDTFYYSILKGQHKT